MQQLTIYDPTGDQSLGKVRGAGRVMQILHENFYGKARFISDLTQVSADDILFVPLWQPFQKPFLKKRIAKKHILLLFDVIPLKYPEHFPIGLKGRWWLIQNLRALGLFDQIITISDQSKEDLIEYLNFDESVVDVVHLTSSNVYFKKTSEKSRDELVKLYNLPKTPYSTYVGDTNWNKNLLTLAHGIIKSKIHCICAGQTFSLISELRSKDPDEQHEFLSTSPTLNHHEQIEFKEFIKLTLNDDHFVFPGFVPDEDLKTIYKHALCNILISRDEGFGLSYLESATQSCPSILSNISVFREIAGNAAYFVDPESPENLAETIMSLLKKPKSYLAMKEKALARSKGFAPKLFAERLLKATS
ncbi:glycosyltransferase family 4 protein [Candidatus Woesebacteria bacterium]|jgi:glycosyltransferase involved in cell wall biosynthesis|nr:glycosyltransferase family 4 protein [Candidatus Woesebacteria bacterium]